VIFLCANQLQCNKIFETFREHTLDKLKTLVTTVERWGGYGTRLPEETRDILNKYVRYLRRCENPQTMLHLFDSYYAAAYIIKVTKGDERALTLSAPIVIRDMKNIMGLAIDITENQVRDKW